MIKITVNNIENSLYSLDSVYRDVLAHSLVKLGYLSDTPLQLSLGTEFQQRELKIFYEKPLTAKQIKKIINYISKEMKNDYQYWAFSSIASEYINIANQIEKIKKTKER